MVPDWDEACPYAAGHLCGRAADWREFKLHSTQEVVPAIEGVMAELASAGFSDRELFAIRLALEEALVNAIKHGHRGDTSKEAKFRYRLTPQCVVAEVEDQGPGFNPQEVPDPFAPENLERSSGRGLLLMRSYMTWVRYNDRGNCVTMCRLLRGA